MAEPDQELLSLLEKTANPLISNDIHLNLKGVFAPPEQWYASSHAGRSPIKPTPIYSPIR